MKWLLVSDLHYTLKQFDWVSSVADQFRLVIIAGDHLDISATVDADLQIVVILKYLRRLQERTRVLVCSGNHDLNGRDDAGERTAKWMAKVRDLGILADGDAVDIDGTLVTVCPWWDGPRAREMVGAQLARDAQRRTERWVWIYHAPPDQSPLSWTGTQYYGDAELRAWISTYHPDIVLTGHIHQAPFRGEGSWVDRIGSTWIFNAGRQIGPAPTHIVFDTDANTAIWFSLAGNQIVRLDEPLVRPLPEYAPV